MFMLRMKISAGLVWGICFSIAVLPVIGVAADTPKTYVGSQVCQQCHEQQYSNYATYSKKARSYDSIKIMQKGLTQEEILSCFKCHTTGYGESSGFRSEKETPHLKNAGCETCHGPGSAHADSEDPDDIKGRLSIADCETCHISNRISAFRFKPMLYGGAH